MAVSTLTNSIATAHSNGSVIDNIIFSIISYNLHGFNQGYTMLSEMCSKFDYNIDCIFIQKNCKIGGLNLRLLAVQQA